MSLNAVKILGISITTNTKKEILEEIQKYLELSNYPIIKLSNKRQKPFIIVTPNPEQIVYAQQDKHFVEILNQADVAIPDGIGLVAAMRLLAQKSDVRSQMSEVRRISGVELMEDLVAMAARRGYPIALIGGRVGVAVRALECLLRKHPGLSGWAMDPGELHLGDLGNLGDLSKKIKGTGVRIVFVGLGAPKQEFFIERLSLSLRPDQIGTRDDTPIVLMSVGGSFDMISGRTPRAPRAIQAIHLEWLWRLIRQPWRLRRQLCLVKFLWLLAIKGLTL